MMRNRVRRRLLLVLAATGTATMFATGTSQAAISSDTILRSWATGVCVDSNSRGDAYAIGCNGGTYQTWFVAGTGLRGCGHYGCGPFVVLRNDATDRVLDSNSAGAVYTNPSNGGSYQKWVMTGNDTVTQFENVQTELCLQTNGDGRLFTTGCGSNYQNWKQGF